MNLEWSEQFPKFRANLLACRWVSLRDHTGSRVHHLHRL